MPTNAIGHFISNNRYVQISGDNRLHIWDINNGIEINTLTEINNLIHNYTCSAISHISTASNKKKSNSHNNQLFAVGTSDGTVIVWDLIKGVVIQTIGVSNKTPIPNDVIFSNDNKSIYVSSLNLPITQYDVSNGQVIKTIKGGKHGTYRIQVNPDIDVIAAGYMNVKLIEMTASGATGRSRKVKSNYPDGIKSLLFSKCGKYMFLSGNNSREILCYNTSYQAEDTSTASESTAASTVVYNLTMDQEPKSIVVAKYASNLVDENGDAVPDMIVTYDNTNYANIIRCNSSSSSSNSSNTITTSKIILSDEIIETSFSSNTKEVTISHGSVSHPHFLTCKYLDDNDSLIELIDTRPKNVGSVTSGAENQVVTSSIVAPVVLNDADKAGMKRSFRMIDDVTNNIDVELNGETFEKKLEKMNTSITALEQSKDNSSGSGDYGMQEFTSDSLVTLIHQAIQSDDQSLIEQCFACHDSDVIDETAKRLDASKVLGFLKILLIKLEKRPSRGVLIIRWLSSVLRFHTSYLVSIPNLSMQLAGLSQILERRLSTYTALAPLKGRLDIIISQLSGSNSNINNNRDSESMSYIPANTYVEI